MIDIVLISCFLAASYINKNNNPATVGYLLCLAYQFTLFDSHSAVVNHLIYGAIFIPMCYKAHTKLAYAMLIYSSFHLIVSIDYLMYPSSETLISSYYNYIQFTLAFSLILIGSGIQYNDARVDFNYRVVGFNLWDLPTHTKKAKRG